MANRFKIGEIDVTVVSDGVARVPPTVYFRGTTDEQWAAHKRWLAHDGALEFPFACFVVRSGGRTVLVDTGLGATALFTFTGGALIPELAAAGVHPDEIDTVFVTHLHIDHCGTTVLGGGGQARPAFPNAEYRWTQAEQEFWTGPGMETPLSQEIKDYLRAMFAAVAGRYSPAGDGAALAPGVSVMATPGHTPGHAAVVLASGGERAFILGDAISCPAQLTESEWSGLGDLDPALARKSQEVVLREAEGEGALLTAAHFPGLTFGRVLRTEGRRYWAPL